MERRIIPKRKAAKESPQTAINRLRRGCRTAQVIVRFVEHHPVDAQHLDLFNGLVALYQWAQVHAHFAGFIFGGMEKLAKIPWVRAFVNWLNPRQHSWNRVILEVLGMGAALAVAEVIGEGAPNRSIILLVLTVFIGIEGAGVLLGYVLFRQFLEIIRS
jgi:hypothetical protein